MARRKFCTIMTTVYDFDTFENGCKFADSWSSKGMGYGVSDVHNVVCMNLPIYLNSEPSIVEYYKDFVYENGNDDFRWSVVVVREVYNE